MTPPRVQRVQDVKNPTHEGPGGYEFKLAGQAVAVKPPAIAGQCCLHQPAGRRYRPVGSGS